MQNPILLLAALPATVLLSFCIHWLTIAKIDTAEDRLPHCRGAYLSFSFQLVLYGWALFSLPGRHDILSLLIPLGMTFSFFGDLFNLQFRPIERLTGQPLFFGILCFTASQICYIGGMASLASISTLAAEGHLILFLAVLVVLPAILFRFKVYNPERPKKIMAGAFIYGFILGGMAAFAISAALVYGGFWYAIAGGALFFLLSDAIMGGTTINGRKHPKTEYQIPWITYLIAQGLILFGYGLTRL